MTSSLVGSEMCIRDSIKGAPTPGGPGGDGGAAPAIQAAIVPKGARRITNCLLYTSDAADDM
eukprot:2780447-Prorocentrum_lima.AAC.1